MLIISPQLIETAVVCKVKGEGEAIILLQEGIRGVLVHASYFSHRMGTALTICSQDLLKCHRRKMLVHHVTFLNGLSKNSYHPFSKMFTGSHTHIVLAVSFCFVLNASILHKKPITLYPPNHYTASENQSD